MTIKEASEEDARKAALTGGGDKSRQNISTRGIMLTDAEAEAIMDAYENEDVAEMTWTRRIVENYLQNYSWYFPRKDIPGAPSLAKAWAYYEHVTLPRHMVGQISADGVLRRAEPGEQGLETELYKPLGTGQAHLIEFGIGTDLYFQTCAMLCVMFLIAGIANITNIHFFAEKYSGDKSRGWALEGSAVCTLTYWAVCDDCPEEKFLGEAAERYAEAEDRTILVLRNACRFGLEQGVINWATWLFFFLFLAGMSMYLRAREIRFDEDKLTSSDYSVLVKNPPPDALDPEEWRDYFAQFSEKQVTVVSIHLNNEEMLKKLYIRRIHRDNLRRLLPKGTDLDNEDVVRTAVDAHVREREAEPKGCAGNLLECTVFWLLRKCGMMLQAETLVEMVYDLTFEIKQLQTERYGASKVFVTFETEEGQRAALTALSAARLDIIGNNTQNAPPSAVFHGRVLYVKEPTEPNAIRWLDLSATKLYRQLATFATLGVTVALIALAAFLEDLTRQKLGPRYSGVLVTIFNSVIPIVVKILMLFERHQTEGGFQSSLYLKITLFRWVNTAIALQIITPFTHTLGNTKTDLLPSISAILWSECWITPALRLLDIGGNVQKHVLAPRARTQEQMNMSFLGTRYNLGERYTDLTKVLFVCFFYSALFPASFFFGFVILFVQYFADKFCLLRIWGWSPMLGSKLAIYSRRYFFTGAVVAFVISSSFAWSQFPYDNVCDPVNGTVTPAAIPFTNVITLDQKYDVFEDEQILRNVTVGQVEPVFYCAQGFRQQKGFAFPPKVGNQPEGLKWMTGDQETVVHLFYWSALFGVIIFLVGAFLSGIFKAFMALFKSTYEPEGASQRIDFSCNKEIVAYYPHVKLGSYPHPFIAANVDDLDPSLLGFTDLENHNIDHHNMMFDIPFEGIHRPKREDHSSGHDPVSTLDAPTGSGERKRHVFGLVKHYPPSWWKAEHQKQD